MCQKWFDKDKFDRKIERILYVTEVQGAEAEDDDDYHYDYRKDYGDDYRKDYGDDYRKDYDGDGYRKDYDGDGYRKDYGDDSRSGRLRGSSSRREPSFVLGGNDYGEEGGNGDKRGKGSSSRRDQDSDMASILDNTSTSCCDKYHHNFTVISINILIT